MDVFEATANAWRRGDRAVLATVVGVEGSAPRSAGARMLVLSDGTFVGTVGGGELEFRVLQAAHEVMHTGRPARLAVHLTRDLGMCCGGSMDVYLEPLEGRTPIVMFGGGHVAQATADVLGRLDFGITVVDERDEWANAGRFPGCTVVCGDPRAYAEALLGGPRQYWLVVTHDHRLDQDLVETLLPKPCAWLGMIGSRAKVAKFLIRYRAAGVDPALFPRL